MRTRPWAPPRPPARKGRVVLSAREGQMLTGLFMGLSNQAIAKALGLSEDTVKTLVHRLYLKLAVSNRAQAVALVATEVIAVDIADYGRNTHA